MTVKEAREALEELQRYAEKTSANPGRVEELNSLVLKQLDRLDELEESKTEWMLDLTALKGELEITVEQLQSATERVAELEAKITIKTLENLKGDSTLRDSNKWILQQTKDLATERRKVKLAVDMVFRNSPTPCPPIDATTEPCPPDNGEGPNEQDCKVCWLDWLTKETEGI